MGKKAKEFKAGDFIFAKVKGYPAWPARVQRINGKKYFVYFYGTAEIANLPPNQIFDYAENKDKFLSKSVKRKDFNEGIRQIDYDFTNNIPLEEVLGGPVEEPMDTSAVSQGDETVNDTSADVSAAADTTVDSTADTETNTSQNQGAVDDSDEGALVIDEKKKPKKTPAKPAKEPKATPKAKSKQKKEEIPNDDEEKKDEEIVSRSGRKIRPKRYIDEHTEENATLAPVTKKKRATSPQPAADKEKEKAVEKTPARKLTNKQCHIVAQSELDDIKEPFPENDKESILIAYLPSGQYVGVKLFQSKPTSFSSENGKLQWYRTAASNAITLKSQLEKGQITAQSMSGQLETELNLTDEEKANLDKEREIEEKKSRVQFLKTEMKLIELDSKIKSCLSLEKADTPMCLQHLNELLDMDIKGLMLLKHPTCLETIKRSRSYVGNTPSWEMSNTDADTFNKQAQEIRKLADNVYNKFKKLFHTPEGLSFWEAFSERVMQFKKCTSKLNADALLEMMHEPLEMSVPTSHTNVTAVESANEDEEKGAKKKSTPVKAKKPPAKKEPTIKATPKKRGRPDAETEATEEIATAQDKEKNKNEEEKKVKQDNEKKKSGKEQEKKEGEKNSEEVEDSTKDVEKVDKKGKSNAKKSSESDSKPKKTSEGDSKHRKASEGDSKHKKVSEGDSKHKKASEGDSKHKKVSEGDLKHKKSSDGDSKHKKASEDDSKSKKTSESDSKSKKTSEDDSKSKKASEGDSKSKKASEDDSKSKKTSEDDSKSKKTSEDDSKSKKTSEGDSKSKKASEGDSNDKETNSNEVKETKKNGQPEEMNQGDEKQDEGEKEKEDSGEPVAKKIKENSKKSEPPPVPKTPGKRKSRS